MLSTLFSLRSFRNAQIARMPMPMSMRILTLIVALTSALSLSACGGSGGGSNNGSGGGSTSPDSPAMGAAAKVGEKIFHDVNLSASGKMSCATCHNPQHAHAQDNALMVQLGGEKLATPGFRAVPSLRYLHLTPAFSFASDGTPSGGFTRDGRAPSLARQAETPLLAAHEMANTSRADVVLKVRQSPYAEQFRQAFGASIFDDSDTAFERILFALERYQKEDSDFYPFSSKYDAFLSGKARLDEAELRGLALFNNPQKGNCAACHPSAKKSDGSFPLFTDFTYDNLGLPRNTAIPATADATYFDLGLCGPDRTDLSDRASVCGAFKVPTLRNVATRKVFFHNARFTQLREAVLFYVQRDTHEEKWYPVSANGDVLKFNDLPSMYWNNVNITEVPYNRKRGMAPALTDAEVDDIVRFLQTLNDGYQP